METCEDGDTVKAVARCYRLLSPLRPIPGNHVAILVIICVRKPDSSFTKTDSNQTYEPYESHDTLTRK